MGGYPNVNSNNMAILYNFQAAVIFFRQMLWVQMQKFHSGIIIFVLAKYITDKVIMSKYIIHDKPQVGIAIHWSTLGLSGASIRPYEVRQKNQ